MNYWELRKAVKNFVPRRIQIEPISSGRGIVKEKGRKTQYHQFNLETGEMLKHERLLSEDEVRSFLEVSLRAQACPMPCK